ncbi:GNAT family N-acetyltransferase [Aquirhabdus parva]|uniref:GNAT family N-acetyltransferase n=1 Tax=Aquirhabdus parva TaxID=2283318 RepID=A0A345P8F4_9GAMM|nr:GNAT family N-acetyltransferase [Aquirhabdus parva]AXI03563.1 GNAT family N-acetyltransferase [Aquirhabdus parva]
MIIKRLDPDADEAQMIITQSDAYMASLYPSESNHLASTHALKQSNVLFLGAYVLNPAQEEKLAGCGAVRIRMDDGHYGEIKRLFVFEEYRGLGISKEIMCALESSLIDQEIWIARLETGVKQPEAIALYQKIGYIERGPFASYLPDPLSLFMEKTLSPHAL